MSKYDKYANFIKNTQLMLPPNKWYFKSHPDYTYMLEHVFSDLANRYLDIIKNKFSEIYKNNVEFLTEICALNDKYGMTRKTDFKNFMTCSPSNLRYILHSFLILENMKKLNLNDVNVIEIGGGYGGLCFFVNKIAKLFNININSYTIFDLPEASALQNIYLNALNIENVKCYQLNKFDKLFENSFLISNYAYSEIDISLQKEYSNKIINPYVRYGFLTWNCIPLYDFIENSVIEKEIEYPRTGTVDGNLYVRFYPK